MNLTSKTNFIKANINTNKNLKSTKPFEQSKPFTKSDFGEVPNYLDTIKATITSEKDYFKMLREIQKPKPDKIPFDQDHKNELLERLKMKYDQLSAEYQVS
jgi:hypothetical protein